MTIALIVYLPEGIFLLQSNGNCLNPVAIRLLQSCCKVAPKMFYSCSKGAAYPRAIISTRGRYRKRNRYRKKKEKRVRGRRLPPRLFLNPPVAPTGDMTAQQHNVMATRTKDAVSPSERVSFTLQKSIFRCLKDNLSVLLIHQQNNSKGIASLVSGEKMLYLCNGIQILFVTL